VEGIDGPEEDDGGAEPDVVTGALLVGGGDADWDGVTVVGGADELTIRLQIWLTSAYCPGSSKWFAR